jgi:hypothetical protein
MSLDVSLIYKIPTTNKGTGIFVRENGTNKELTFEEIREKFPNVIIKEENNFETECVFDANITHNLNKMAHEAGIYYACWRPEEINASKASDILPLLKKGFDDMKARPEHFKKFDSENGLGTYKDFFPWVKAYLNACQKYPDAIIDVIR